MEPIIIAFGNALVAAMATDSWEQARSAVVALWRRIRLARQADIAERQLDRLREEVLEARRAGEADTEQALAVIWQERLQELMLNNPDLPAELQRILSQTLTPMLEPAERVGISQIMMTGSSHGSSTFNQVAGNQINIRP